MKVVVCSTDTAGRFAAKLLGMSGAEVLRVHTPGTTALDRYLDVHSHHDPRPIAELVEHADVVFTTFDRGSYVGAGADPAVRAAGAPWVEVTTSSYGATGPYARRRGGPLADWAAGGYLAITGWPDREPLAGPEHLCGYVAGYTAAIAAEAALAERARTGRGRHVDVSTMEAMLSVHQSTFSRLAAGIARERSGRYTEVYPLVVRPCRDGHVSLGVVTDAEFDRLAIAVGRADLAADPRFADAAARWEHRDELDAELAEFLEARSTAEVVGELLAHGVAAAAVAGAQDVLSNPQLAHRRFWDVSTGAGADAPAPGNPIPAARRTREREQPARRLGTPPRDPTLPLAGVVVLDFTAFWAGPSATRVLADLGARVIWIERPHSRAEPGPDATDLEVVMHHFHLKMNRNKESVVLDLTTAGGQDIARRLSGAVDVVVENFRPGVMARMGLGAAALGAAHPSLVYVSLSGFGHDGPWADRRSYGPTIEAASSIEGRTGYAGGEPLRLGHTLPDGVGGLVGALAALRGLRERGRTGRGGWFDLSQLEAYVALSGEELLGAAASGDELERIGNRSRSGAMQGVYPCAGTDRWVTIRLADADDVARAVGVTGAVDLVAAHADGDHDAVDRSLRAFTTARDALEVAQLFQDAGLEAFVALTPQDLVDDPHLDQRGFFLTVEHDGRPLRLPGSPLSGLTDPRGNAPRFGAHTASVLAELDQVDR